MKNKKILLILAATLLLCGIFIVVNTTTQKSQFINIGFSQNDVDKVEIKGPAGLYYTYTDKQRITAVIDYIKNIELNDADESELPNMSADVRIVFFNDGDKKASAYWLYGEPFIKDCTTQKTYKLKHDIKKYWIIRGLEILTSELN